MKYSKETNKLIQDIGLDEKNTGSSEAQIALLTDRIRSLTEHVKDNKKDVHSRYGLVKLVSQRKKQLNGLLMVMEMLLVVIKILTVMCM